jgi:Domain of unknown function (DUF4956)
MSVIKKTVDRITFPAESPLLALTVYYALLYSVAAILLWLFPGLQQAFSGERLTALLNQSVDSGGGLPFTSPSGGSEVGISWEFSLFLGLAMVGAFLLMLPTSWVYMATRQKKGFDQNIVQTLIVLAMAVSGVVVIVRNSLALAFSLAGIVGAVRFRNTLPDTRDTLYVFLSIGVGLAAGVEALAAAAVLSMVFNYFVVIMHRANYGMCELGTSSRSLLHTHPARIGAVPGAETGNGKRRLDYNAVLVVRTNESDQTKRQIGPFLDRSFKRWELAEEESTKKGRTHLKYLVRLGKQARTDEVEDALLQLGSPHVVGVKVH